MTHTLTLAVIGCSWLLASVIGEGNRETARDTRTSELTLSTEVTRMVDAMTSYLYTYLNVDF